MGTPGQYMSFRDGIIKEIKSGIWLMLILVDQKWFLDIKVIKSK